MKLGSAALIATLRDAGLTVECRGEIPESFAGVADDTRAVQPGSLFIAVRGAARDGHDFLEEAASRGAAAAVVEDASRTTLPAIVVSSSRRAAAAAGALAYGMPATELRIIGVTGTNGKTTTVSILRHLLDSAGEIAASVGTLGVLVGDARPLPGGSGLTTPGPLELQRLFRELVRERVRTVVMEVSSHSLDQHRVDGVTFEAAVFTNLTRDHLDYHGTMEAYFSAKAKLVSLLSPAGTAIVNADAPEWRALPPAPRTLTYGISAAGADVTASGVSAVAGGTRWTLASGSERAEVALPLSGAVNVYNAIAASATAIALGKTVAECAERLASLPQVPGRLERIAEAPVVLRDYAHTPDALERTLLAAKEIASGRVILVFGCGGDRDRGKRPLMGKVAERLADISIVTSDNPRTEDPDRIIDEIESGMTDGAHERVTDRRAAIARALAIARADDLVVLAGKGHETYQIRGTESFPFDEREIVREMRKGSGG